MLKELIASVMLGLNGFAALEADIPVGEEYSAIVCNVIDTSSDEDYVACENYKDAEDIVWLDRDNWELGNTLKVTFEHDDVYEVLQVGNMNLEDRREIETF